MASGYALSFDDNEELSCTICFHIFEEPRILNCGHSFCRKCLEKLVHRNQRQCPVCRSQFPDESSGAHDFPQNYSLKKAVLYLKSGKQQNENLDASLHHICATHQKPKVFFCKGTNCSEPICDDCWSTNHIDQSEGHRIVPKSVVVSEIRKIAGENTEKVLAYQEAVKKIEGKAKSFSSSLFELMEKVNEMSEFHLEFVSNTVDCNLHKYTARMLQKQVNNQENLQALKQDLDTMGGLFNCALEQLDLATQGGNQTSDPPESRKSYQRRDLVAIDVLKRLPMDCLDDFITLKAQVFDHHCERVICSFENVIFVFDHNLDYIEKFTLPRCWPFQRTVESVAVGGDDLAMYVLQKTTHQRYILSAVKKTNGEVLRVMRQSEKSVVIESKIAAIDNCLFILEKMAITKTNKNEDIMIHLFENEVFEKTIQTNATHVNEITITPRFILVYSESNKIVIQGIENSDLLKRKIELADVNLIKKIMFIPDSDDPDPTSGYLFVTHLFHNLYHYLKVFHVNLATVENFAVLQPIEFDFMKQRCSKQTNYLLAVGTDRILCRGQFNDGMFVLKLGFK
ncbi:uncharacterized protein LOC142353649 isoform X2 [Convolutriloba macropyga]|uniref:uncharacterized protein LOC142353649 isoform X2 n=1 Tax=Convolutriloba macropyga TaxID=536237 RepID=UPI003F525125